MSDSGKGIKGIGEAVGNVLLSPLESVCDGAEAIGKLPGQLRDGDHGAIGRGLLDIAGAASTIATGGADPAALAKGAAAKGIVGQAAESAGLKPGEIVLGQSCLDRVFNERAEGAPPLSAIEWMNVEPAPAGTIVTPRAQPPGPALGSLY